MSHSAVIHKFRFGHLVPRETKAKRGAPSCTSGGFYKSPTAKQVVPAGQLFTIAWDTSCLDTKAVDIYLSTPAPNLVNPRIHLWSNVNFQKGSLETTLNAHWWNNTPTASVQLTIVPHGVPNYMSDLPAAPYFNATTPVSGSPVLGDKVGAIENVNNFDVPKLSKGKVAAAVLMPLLTIVGILVGLWIWKQRRDGRQDRKKWNEAVDKRMSTISADWKSITPAGASAAVRHSMAPGDRASAFSFGAIRPISTVALDGGQAGLGAKGLQTGGIDLTTPQMSQLRSGLRNPSTLTGERVSRISFAPDTRPSGESRRSLHNQRASRFQQAPAVPPLPDRLESGDMSPTQTAGPLTLTAEDIKARMSGHDDQPRPSVDEVFPALSMMRTGEDPADQDEMLIQPPAPAHPASPKSPVMGVMPMQPMPAAMMSPDEMLRVYAEQRRGITSPPPGGPAVPAPVANYNGNGMRVLYSPSTADSGVTSPTMTSRKSLVPTIGSKYDEDDAYGGTV